MGEFEKGYERGREGKSGPDTVLEDLANTVSPFGSKTDPDRERGFEQGQTELAVCDTWSWKRAAADTKRALATAEVHAKGHSLNVLSLMKFNDQLKEEIAALREQVAEREDAAFKAGWNAGKACHTGIATLTEARAVWRARQKGTPT
jgi:hypothetical protein